MSQGPPDSGASVYPEFASLRAGQLQFPAPRVALPQVDLETLLAWPLALFKATTRPTTGVVPGLCGHRTDLSERTGHPMLLLLGL